MVNRQGTLILRKSKRIKKNKLTPVPKNLLLTRNGGEEQAMSWEQDQECDTEINPNKRNPKFLVQKLNHPQTESRNSKGKEITENPLTEKKPRQV